MYTAWYDEHLVMLGAVNELYVKIRRFNAFYCPTQKYEKDIMNDYAYDCQDLFYTKIFDMKETIFLFFFDS